jgi:hypothetical protein
MNIIEADESSLSMTKESELWVDKYAPKHYIDLLSSEVSVG